MAQTVKNLPAMQETQGSIPGSGRCPGEGNGYPLQYSCLENPLDRGAWRAAVYGGHKEPNATERLTVFSKEATWDFLLRVTFELLL